MMKTYDQVRDWLESFIPQVYGKSELGLERISNLLFKLGNPQKNFKSILVGGTAGKGSTAFYIARLLQFAGPVITFPPASAHSIKKSNFDQKNNVELRAVGNLSSSATRNYKIGLHVSPHLVDIRERMQIFSSSSVIPAKAGISKNSKILDQVENDKSDSSLMPMHRLVGLVNQIKPVVEAIGVSQPELLPSYFEILVALSFLYFKKEKVEWAVVEVGLGGRLDATNVLTPEICVITNVGLDHTEILGNIIEKIAAEKAGIIKEGIGVRVKGIEKNEKRNLVVTGATGKGLKVIEKVAKNKKAILIKYNTLSEQKRSKTDIEKSVFSHYYRLRSQEQSFAVFNKNLALLTVLTLKMDIREDAVKKAFSGNFVGRFEEIDDGVIIDGAHNPDKIKALIEFLNERHSRPRTSHSEPVYNEVRQRRLDSESVRGRPDRESADLRIREDDKNGITLVLAFKKGKNWQEMIDLLLKNLSIKKIIATKYQAVTDTGKGSSVEPEKIARYVESRLRQGYDGQAKWKVKVESIANSQEAVMDAIGHGYSSSERSESRSSFNEKFSTGSNNNLVVVTGSLYLVGEVRTLWHLPSFWIRL